MRITPTSSSRSTATKPSSATRCAARRARAASSSSARRSAFRRCTWPPRCATTAAASSSAPNTNRRSSKPRARTSRRPVCRASSICAKAMYSTRSRRSKSRSTSCCSISGFRSCDPRSTCCCRICARASVICADNTAGDFNRRNYAPFFEIIDDPAQRFHTITLPFKGGFEMAVKG